MRRWEWILGSRMWIKRASLEIISVWMASIELKFNAPFVGKCILEDFLPRLHLPLKLLLLLGTAPT